MFRLVGATYRDADIVGLLLRQGGKLGSEFVQVQAGDFLVQFLVQTINADLAIRFLRMSICAMVWFVKLLDITKLGWPVAHPRLIRRPSASR